MTAVFDMDALYTDSSATFDIFQVLLMEYFTSLSISIEQYMTIAIVVVTMDTSTIAIGNFQLTIGGLESGFGDAWSVVSGGKFSLVSAVSDVVYIFQTDVSGFDFTTLDDTVITRASFWTNTVNYDFAVSIITQFISDVT